MNAALVVLAAGIGARYGAGVKQLAKVGPYGELIIDYSIHDAVRAGFDKIVFILRRDIYDDFRAVIGDRLERTLLPLGVTCEYVFQEIDDLPAGREKPWGTGHALLSCKDVLSGPFTVINADDYYGKSAFSQAYAFMREYTPARPHRYGLIGYILRNTLSDAGGVTRGICTVDDKAYLKKIHETREIFKTHQGAVVQAENGPIPLNPESLVSMNMWMLTTEFMDELQIGYRRFLAQIKDPIREEYLLPEIIDELLQSGKATVKVLPTEEEWFGVTYREDIVPVKDAFRCLTEQGEYSRELFFDLLPSVREDRKCHAPRIDAECREVR